MSCQKNGMNLCSIATDLYSKNKEVLRMLETYRYQNDLVHAVFAMDIRQILKIKLEMHQNTFDTNIADYCYCFSWFKPVCRNLPRFLFEVALDTKQESIIKIVINWGADVNLLHSKSGNPFFFYAFELGFSTLKNDILRSANFFIKNYRGQNILFHLVQTYASQTNLTEFKYLLNDFHSLLTKHPMLIAQRDQEDVTLVETILTMPPVMYLKAVDFLIEISFFILDIINAENMNLLQEFFLSSYGLVFLNSPVYIEKTSGDFGPEYHVMNLERYLNEINNKSSISPLKSLIGNEFVNLVADFLKSIKAGDLEKMKAVMSYDKRKCLTKVKDFSSRTCLHIAVLYSQATIAK